MLNVIAKLKNSYTIKQAPPLKKSLSGQSEGGESELQEDAARLKRCNTMGVTKKQKTEKYSHLLIGRVKDTQILFSFIVEASVVEFTDQQPMFS
jgi:hypothetical protein